MSMVFFSLLVLRCLELRYAHCDLTGWQLWGHFWGQLCVAVCHMRGNQSSRSQVDCHIVL